jgi:hypothetical protein
MATLDCGVNWFSGSVDKDQIISDPRLAPIAFTMAQTAAFVQTWKEMMEKYKLRCPPKDEDNDCTNKFGEYGLSIKLSTATDINKATKKVIKVKAHCKVDWILRVTCSEKAAPVVGPIVGDFEKLEKERSGHKG